ncbi:MAG: hypothetical protein JSW15_08075, partial [Deltaproteobacteria bacterium]
MKAKNILIILLAVILAGTISYSLYFHFGPYKRVSEENQQVRRDIKASRALQSEMEEQISQQEKTLEETQAELAKRTTLTENLEAKLGELQGAISKTKTEKRTAI